jgi:hypothetical protein
VFNAADTLFRCFLPVDFEGPTVGQYWGAVQSLVDVSETLPPFASIPGWLNKFRIGYSRSARLEVSTLLQTSPSWRLPRHP